MLKSFQASPGGTVQGNVTFITAGDNLTGGGPLSGNVTIALATQVAIKGNAAASLLVGQGNLTWTWNSGITPIEQVSGAGATGMIGLTRMTAPGAAGAQLALGATRGTSVGDYTIVQANDGLGAFAAYGADGVKLKQAAQVFVIVDGTPSANVVPGLWRVQTADATTGGLVTGLDVDSSQNILIKGGAGKGNGAGGISIANATTTPSSNPVAGGLLYVAGGSLVYRGSNGTVTIVGPA